MITGTKDLLKTLTRHIRAVPRDGDTYDENNILICGKCGEPREFVQDLWQPAVFDSGMKNMLVGKEPRYVVRPIPCRCDEERKRDDERRLAEAELERKRAQCFDIKGYETATFDNYDDTDSESYSVVQSFISNFEKVRKSGQGMLFTGAIGTGKTFTAACVANRLLEEGYKVKFTSLALLNAQMTEDYGKRKGIILTYLRGMNLVVLDDLGTERKTQTANENVYQIINALYSAKVPVILTTNLDFENDLATNTELENARIYSRIIGQCKPVNFIGRDRRKRVSDRVWDF